MVLIEFSSNGWFGVISDEVTFENISIIAQAAADYLNDTPSPGHVALGYDSRFLSREYAWTIQRVLTGNGIKVFMHKKPVPASFLSLSVRLYDADLGIMVTGEGRPARYSGLTFRLRGGYQASETWMNTLFNYLYRRYPRSSDDSRHLLQYIDVYRDYAGLIRNYIDFDMIREMNPFIGSDSFFGSVGTYFQELLKENGITGIHIRTKPNPGFLDSIPQPNDRNMQPLSKLVVQKHGQMGLFFNGDGSHYGVVSSSGEFLSCMQASAVILDEWLNLRGREFEIYTEFFTPVAVNRLAAYNHMKPSPLCKVWEENRGLDRGLIWDRHSVIFGPFLPERDGIFQGLLLLQALCRHDMDWQKLHQKVEKFTENRCWEQKSINMDISAWEKKRKSIFEQGLEMLGDITEIMENDSELKLLFSDGSWLGFDYNGKEGSLFIYCDATNSKIMEQYFPAVITWLLQ
jgi:phosphomannomutase